MWEKGQSGNKKGRPVRNEREKYNIAYFKKKIQGYSVDALEKLVYLMDHSMNQEIVYKCATYLLDKNLGKGPLEIEGTEQKDNVLKLKIISVPGKDNISKQEQKEISEAENSIYNINETDDWDINEGDCLDDDWGSDVYNANNES